MSSDNVSVLALQIENNQFNAGLRHSQALMRGLGDECVSLTSMLRQTGMAMAGLVVGSRIVRGLTSTILAASAYREDLAQFNHVMRNVTKEANAMVDALTSDSYGRTSMQARQMLIRCLPTSVRTWDGVILRSVAAALLPIGSIFLTALNPIRLGGGDSYRYCCHRKLFTHADVQGLRRFRIALFRGKHATTLGLVQTSGLVNVGMDRQRLERAGTCDGKYFLDSNQRIGKWTANDY
jgi:hypothetical protein